MTLFKTNIKLLIILFILLGLSFQPNFVYGAASGGDSSDSASDKVNLYKAGKKLVLRAKKLEKKDKIEKAKTLYLKAYKKLEKAYAKDKKKRRYIKLLGLHFKKNWRPKTSRNLLS